MKIHLTLLLLATYFLSQMGCGLADWRGAALPADSVRQSVVAACAQFEYLNKALDKYKLMPDSAQTQFRHILPALDAYYAQQQLPYYTDTAWVFPVRGYTPAAIGGTARDKYGFVDNGCGFFDRGINPGHPAYDIFIRDLNNDGIDDRTRQCATVLSMTGGVVVDTEPEWQSGNTGRGGRYIWIYDPAGPGFLYYAHNNDLYVKPGDIVTPGQPIATLGRTGSNARKERSQTHLHFCYYRYTTDSLLKPARFYNSLAQAHFVPHPSNKAATDSAAATAAQPAAATTTNSQQP